MIKILVRDNPPPKASIRRGAIVDIRPAHHVWARGEGQPDFIQVEITDAANAAQIAPFLALEAEAFGGEILRRIDKRKFQVKADVLNRHRQGKLALTLAQLINAIQDKYQRAYEVNR